MKVCLGIESTAHTFGVGIVDFDGNFLANARDAVSLERGGMVPSDVADHHEEVKEDVLKEALDEAGLSKGDIDVISFSRAPGLPPPLVVGKDFATGLAKDWDKPLVGVNHCMSHLTIGKLLSGMDDPLYVYVSGPNTQILARAGDRMRVIGETIDVGLGNALDKFARAADLGFPGGPEVEKLAKEGEFVELPYVVKGMDVSFSGILTRAKQLLGEDVSVEDLCYSFQEFCFAMLTEVSERALSHTGRDELILTGGVAANDRLRDMMDEMCSERGAEFYAPPLEYCGDQGVMIAWQGVLQYKAGDTVDPEIVDIDPRERTDDVEIAWD